LPTPTLDVVPSPCTITLKVLLGFDCAEVRRVGVTYAL